METVVGRRWRQLRWRRAVGWSLAVLAVVGLALFSYMKLVEGAWLKYNKWDRRERGTLHVGAQAPDLEVLGFERGTLRLSELWRERPVVLVFGSCT